MHIGFHGVPLIFWSHENKKRRLISPTWACSFVKCLCSLHVCCRLSYGFSLASHLFIIIEETVSDSPLNQWYSPHTFAHTRTCNHIFTHHSLLYWDISVYLLLCSFALCCVCVMVVSLLTVHNIKLPDYLLSISEILFLLKGEGQKREYRKSIWKYLCLVLLEAQKWHTPPLSVVLIFTHDEFTLISSWAEKGKKSKWSAVWLLLRADGIRHT